MVDLPGFKGLSWNTSYWGEGFTRRKLRAVWLFVVIISILALLPSVIYLFYKDHTSARQVILVVGSIFTFCAVPTTLYGIWQHISNYTQPLLQRYIIRILWMVPIYALDSWIVLLLTRACLAKYAYIPDTLREAYEAYTLYNFFNYLIKYLEISSGMSVGQLLEDKNTDAHSIKHLPPFHFKFRTKSISVLAPWDPGHNFFEKCRWGVMSYAIFSPVYAIVKVVYESTKADDTEKRMFEVNSLYFWFTLAQSLISVWAVYCLVLFYHEARQELKPIKPLGKFLSIKGIVFATFWQNLVLQLLSNFWIAGEGNIYDKKDGLWNCPYGKYQVTNAINDFLLCIEMFVLSISFAFSFPSSEFKLPIDATGQMTDGTAGGEVTVLARSNIGPKLKALFDVGDVRDDFLGHTSRLIGDGTGSIFQGTKQFMRYAGRFLKRLFGYDSYQSSYLLAATTGQNYHSTSYEAPEVPSHLSDSLDDVLSDE